jgi:putative aminopeptidase
MVHQRLSAAWAVVCVVLGANLAVRGQEPPPSSADLVRLIEAQGIAGFETDVRDLLVKALPPWTSSRVDEIGNLIVTIGQGQPHVLVTTSMDEDGFIVSGITDDGYLRLQRVTTGATHRLFDQFHYGQPVLVRTTRGTFVPAVTGAASTHLLRGTQQPTGARGLEDLWVDVGAERRADAEKLGIQLLNPVSLRERAQALAGERVAGVAAQARAGTLALLRLLTSLDRARPFPGTLTIAWTAQGAFGERGMARLGQEVNPDRAIVVARTPVSKETDARGAIGRLGGGPIVGESDPGVIDQARRSSIPFQALPSLKVPSAWSGKSVQVFALPVMFAQSPVETVDLDDVAALTRLIRVVAGLPETGSRASQVLSALPQAKPAVRATVAMEAPLFKMLRPLVEAYGVSGKEARVRELVAGQLPGWAKPQVDERGNLMVSFGQGGKQLLFVAHTDEIGYELTGILEDGTATVRKRGGFFDALLEAHPVLVHTGKGVVRAVVAPRANYLRSAEWQPKPDELSLYFGTATHQETEALGVAIGDTATVRKTFVPLAGTRATARSIDDRAGCAALLAALGRIDPAKVQNRVTFAWVVEEETGLLGAGFLAGRLHPEYAFAVDTFVSSDSPLDSRRMAYIPLGSGAVLRAIDNSSITPPEVVARVADVARTDRIRIFVGTTGGGNDASMFSRYGASVAPLSWPGRYSHSPVEVIDGRDLDALAGLIVALAHRF